MHELVRLAEFGAAHHYFELCKFIRDEENIGVNGLATLVIQGILKPMGQKAGYSIGATGVLSDLFDGKNIEMEFPPHLMSNKQGTHHMMSTVLPDYLYNRCYDYAVKNTAMFQECMEIKIHFERTDEKSFHLTGNVFFPFLPRKRGVRLA